MRALPTLGQLTLDSWNDFRKRWNATFTITAWFLLAPAFSFLLALATRSTPDLASLFVGLLSILGVVVTFWTLVRTDRFVLAADRGDKPEANEMRAAWPWVMPFVVVTLLEGLSVLGGLVAFVLPGIWLTGALLFSRFALLEEGRRGTQALARSMELVRGRWFPIFIRYLLPSLLFLIVMLAVTAALAGIIGAIAGFPKLGIILRADNTDPLAAAVQQLIQSFAQAIFYPLFVTLQVKLFHACKATMK